MAYMDSSPNANSDPHLQAVGENVLRARQEVERVRRQTKVAQRSAAESFAKSADSHDCSIALISGRELARG